MPSYLSSLTSQYTSLKRLLPTSLSEDTDRTVSSEADSHVSRVLRAYYTEKGRPFPAWLGPDPNASSRPSITALSATSSTTGAGSLRAGRSALASAGGGLGDLFADSPSQRHDKGSDSLSLRQRRPGVRSPGFQGGSSDSIPYPQRVTQPPPLQHSRSPSSSSTQNMSMSLRPNVRPLPSQREGSYQSRSGMLSSSSNTSVPSVTSGGSYSKGNSVQERLKARFGASGGRADSTPPPPSSSDSGAGEYDPYSSSNYSLSGGSGFNPYETSGSSGGKTNLYPSASDSRPPHTDKHSSGKTGGSGAPYVAASSPWVNGDDGYGSGNTNGNSIGSSGDYGGGLPGALNPNRRGPTLPNSPRRR